MSMVLTFLMQFVYIGFFTLLISYITERIPFTSSNYQFDKPKRSAILSMKVISVEIILELAYIWIVWNFIIKTSVPFLPLIQISFNCVMIAIIVIIILREKETLESIGITKRNLMKSCLIGIMLGILFFLIYHFFRKNNIYTCFINMLTMAGLISFIKFIFVGVAEEIVYRGYLQTRLIAWLGTKKGCLITAVIFSFIHLPVNLVFKGMDIQTAFFQSVNLIPLSLFLGYTMIKTKNITSVAIFHTILDWTVN